MKKQELVSTQHKEVEISRGSEGKGDGEELSTERVTCSEWDEKMCRLIESGGENIAKWSPGRRRSVTRREGNQRHGIGSSTLLGLYSHRTRGQNICTRSSCRLEGSGSGKRRIRSELTIYPYHTENVSGG